MPDRYRDILTRCLQFESKAERDAVLADYNLATQAFVRGMMGALARRLATRIRYTGRDNDDLTANDRRALRNTRLAEIEPAWLRERVETMVREHFEQRQQPQQEAHP